MILSPYSCRGNSVSQVLQIGSLVNDDMYKLIEIIGSGSTSTIYKATHVLTNRIVVLKVLKPEEIMDSATLKRFQLEARAASSISHRNVVAAYDFGILPSGQPFLTMEFCEGKTVAELVRERALQVTLAVSVILEVCEALEHIHRAGIVHRGINPTDIIVNINTHGDVASLKIIDFGYAKILSADADTKRLMATGELLGRAHYMSPEQCQGQEVDSRSDVYSLGCVMYETLTGNPPFKGDSFINTMMKQISDTAPSFSDSCPNLAIPAEIEVIVFKALEKDPSERYQSMVEMRKALGQKSTQAQKGKWWRW